MHSIARNTQSLCPVCLKKIDAYIYEKDSKMYMKKKCLDHGKFDTLVWEDTEENYLQWIEYGGNPADLNQNKALKTVNKGCPFDCGICSGHANDITSAALMTTNVCDINCPICFTKDKGQGRYMPSIKELLSIAENYKNTYSSEHLIEFCGGEPTVRDDLPHLASELRNMGFNHIQLNTNGLRISLEKEYLERLKDNGVSVIYLGFDGVSDDIYMKKYGRKMLDVKIKAIENCVELEIAVVLVPVIMKGVNTHSMNEILEVAKKYMPAVKAVHFQPISYFGNYPETPSNEDRITMPEVLREIEKQTKSEVKISDFRPGGCEHALCSFSAFYMMNNLGELKNLTTYSPRGEIENSAKNVIENNKKSWKYSKFKTLAIGGMHFQDVWNIDLERLRKCRICILNSDNNIIPLCAKYVTSIKDEKLYEGIS